MDESQGGRRRDVIELFRASRRPLTAHDVAAEIGLHLNTARFHLDTLVRQGILRREDGQSDRPGRPRTQYLLVPGMDRGGTRNFKLLAEMLLTHLATAQDPTAAAVDAGAQWGRYLVQPPAPGQRIATGVALERLVDLLADVGFQPHSAIGEHDESLINLRHCPFLELAETHQDLVCAMHLGLMRGALERLGASLHAETLTPFADPHTCVAHLRSDTSTIDQQNLPAGRTPRKGSPP